MRHYARNVYPGENEKDLSALLLSKSRDQKEIQTGKRKKKYKTDQLGTPNAETEKKLSTGVVWTQEQD